MAVSVEKTAGEILFSNPGEKDIVSHHLHDIFTNQISSSKYESIEMWKFMSDLASEGVSPTLPTLSLAGYKDGKISQANGTAVFKRDKMVGWLDTEETRDFLWVRDRIKRGVMAIENTGREGSNMSLEIMKSKTKIKPIYLNNRLIMKIDIKSEMLLSEISISEDLTRDEAVEMLKKAAASRIEKDAGNIVKIIQSTYGSDVFGFGKAVEIDMPALWKRIKSDWDSVYKSLETQTNAEIIIRGSALTKNPIPLGD